MNDDDKLIQTLQNKVKESQSELDAKTLGQLRAARRTAIDSLNKKSVLWWQLPITRYALSSVFVIAITISVMFPVFNGPNEEYDLEIVAISEDLELLEDLDFYLWIADSIENEG